MATPEVALLPVLASHKAALAEGREKLEALIGLRVPEKWPQFPEAFDPEGSTQDSDWGGFFFVASDQKAVVGNGGFVGVPKHGMVEIGYEIAPEFQNKGYATEAVRVMIRKAFNTESVQVVAAHTLAERNASNAVLVKVGMKYAAELPNEEVGKVWRWELIRS